MLENRGKRERIIRTLHGLLPIRRTVLRPLNETSRAKLLKEEGTKSIVPIDELLRIDRLPFRITISMMMEIAEEAVIMNSYKAVEKRYREKKGIDISDDLIREIVDFVGERVVEDNRKKADSARLRQRSNCEGKCAKHPEEGILFMETDGASVCTRGEDGKGTFWHENKLGMVFNSSDIHFWTDRSGKQQHRILKREFVNYLGSASEFKYYFLDLALRYGVYERNEVVLISDGALWIQSMASELFPDAVHIIDLFHLKENVGEYAKYIIGENSDKYHPWTNRICNSLEEGNWKEVLKELKQYENRHLPQGVPNLYSYIENHRECLDYPSYKKKGYFVGSGAVESANRYVMQNRMKLPGMRWTKNGAQRMLALKAKYESGLWSDVEKLVRDHLS